MIQQSLVEEQLDAVVSEFDGRVGYACKNLDSSETVTRHAEDWFPTASTIKLPVLTVFNSFIDKMPISWDDAARVEESCIPGGSGVLEHLTLPRYISYRDAAWLMICVSDNLATNIILRTMGIPKTNELLHELVDIEFSVAKYAGFSADSKGTSMGRATPGAFLRYLEALHAGSLPSAADTILTARNQVFNDSIPRYLPFSSYGKSGLTIAHKTGALPGVRADVGLICAENRHLAMAILTDRSRDDTFTFGNAGQECIGRVARILYDAWMRDST